MRNYFAILLTMTTLFCGCDRQEMLARKDFEQRSENCICLDNNGKTIFTYNENDCQLCYIKQDNTFRVGKDDMTDYYELVCSEDPVLDNSLTADITWTTEKDIRTRSGIDFKVLKIDDKNTIWLWNAKSRIGVVVRKLY